MEKRISPVYFKRNVRFSKTEPLVDEAELQQANSHYAHIRFPDGRETTVSTKGLAPKRQPSAELTEPVSQQLPEPYSQLSTDSTKSTEEHTDSNLEKGSSR